MLLATDIWIYNFLSNNPLYNEDQGQSNALEAPINKVVDHVVRRGCSEYHRLVDSLEVPMIAIGLADPLAPTFGYSQTPWKCAEDAPDGFVLMANPPKPISTQYMLEVRSPDELWLRRIEAQLMRYLHPVRSIEIECYPFGVEHGLKTVQARFNLSEPRRPQGLQGDQSLRYFVSMFDLVVDQWLFGGNANIEGQPESDAASGLVRLYERAIAQHHEMDSGVNLETQEV